MKKEGVMAENLLDQFMNAIQEKLEEAGVSDRNKNVLSSNGDLANVFAQTITAPDDFRYSVLDTILNLDINNSARVERLQTQLVALGHDPGPIDGDWGPKTRLGCLACLIENAENQNLEIAFQFFDPNTPQEREMLLNAFRENGYPEFPEDLLNFEDFSLVQTYLDAYDLRQQANAPMGILGAGMLPGMGIDWYQLLQPHKFDALEGNINIYDPDTAMETAKLQATLFGLGYDVSAIDDDFGANTRQTIFDFLSSDPSRFRVAEGFYWDSPNEHITDIFEDLEIADRARIASGSDRIDSSFSGFFQDGRPDFSVLSHDATKSLQELLTQRGFYNGPISGVPGTQTQTAFNLYFDEEAAHRTIERCIRGLSLRSSDGTGLVSLNDNDNRVNDLGRALIHFGLIHADDLNTAEDDGFNTNELDPRNRLLDYYTSYPERFKELDRESKQALIYFWEEKVGAQFAISQIYQIDISSPIPFTEQVRLTHPITGNDDFTSDFGTRIHPISGEDTYHQGLDISADRGTGLRWPSEFGDGIVSRSTIERDAEGVSTGWGQYMNVKTLYQDGQAQIILGYAHLSDRRFAAGEVIEPGEIFAKTGNSGSSTGPHLDFRVGIWCEERGDYCAVDPRIAFLIGDLSDPQIRQTLIDLSSDNGRNIQFGIEGNGENIAGSEAKLYLANLQEQPASPPGKNI